MEKVKSTKFFFLILLFAAFIIIKFSPSFFPYYLPDSYDYTKIENSFDRKLFYTLFFIFMENIGVSLINIQVLILSLSISYLTINFFSLNKNKIISLIFFLLIALNFYYTSFSKVVLPESIFFSLINFSVGLILEINKNNNLQKTILLSLCIGLIAITKKIGIVLSIIFIIYFFYKYTNKKLKIIFISIISLIFITENVIFFKHHEQRGSVIPTAILGKLFYISGYSSFNTDNYNSLRNFRNEMLIIKNKSKLIHDFLNTLENPFLRSELQSDYEVVLQYQNIFGLENYQEISKFIKNNYSKVFLDIIKSNPLEYIKVSLNHYMGMWIAGGKFLEQFQEKIKNNSVPFVKYLKNSSSEMNTPGNFIVTISHYTFIFFFLIFLILSFIYFIKLLINRKVDIIMFLLIFCNVYLCLIAFVNVSTIRYLMPILPMVNFILLIIINNKVLKNKCVE